MIVGKETYFAVCSMNTSFKPKAIPAFYQLYMKYLGIGRFDDIWSGILKKIVDHLGDKMCLGAPLVYHYRRQRDIFTDLRAELEGIAMNDQLWRIVDGIELNCNNYYNCYRELILGIKRKLSCFKYKLHKDFMQLQVQKMGLWLKIIDLLA